MKIKNLINICFVCLVLWGCQAKRVEYFPWETKETSQKSAKAAMLLPLSGKSANVGEAFRNSAMMALQEQQGSPLELMFFDTKGTENGVVEAWHEARVQGPDVVIGPVFAQELKSLKSESPDAPIISFTTDSSLMESGVYTMGVLIPNQIERLVNFMCEKGERKIAVIGPEDKTGELTMNTLSEAINSCPDMTLKHISLYEPETTDFMGVITKISPKLVDPRKTNLTEREKAILATPIEERLDFDALLIFEEGVRLQQILSLLAYYDISPKVVSFYGLANWQGSRDRGLIGGYFAATPVARTDVFNGRYREAFGENPPRIAALAYDAVSLVSVLAEKQALTSHNLSNPTGFNGVNGRFRLKRDGTNERLLDVFQITSGGRSETVSPAPDFFEESPPAYPAM
ncbi:MAG: penicillin-binding protein activator [Alphaproteobacteria bacterium]|nr:penicillin-binding protein activator [Alphaproteobacteria bacterium]